MASPETIREITERSVKLLSMKPERGHLKGITTARIENGMRCTIEDGPWTFAADMPVKAGGEESAPTPGALGRGAFASCIAVTLVAWAARWDIPLDSVQVHVETEFDARGELGMDDSIYPGYDEVRYEISIDSPAPAEVIAELVATAERYSPYVDVFARGQSMKRIVRLNGEEV
jgi:uncharacterized OsmC-like protein